MEAHIPDINGMNLIVDDTINLQMESIGTQSTVSTMSDEITNQTQALVTAWTSCDESNPSDPAYKAWYYLQLASSGTAPSGPSFPIPTDPLTQAQEALITNPSTASGRVDAWVNLFLGGSTAGVSPSDMSSYFLVEVYNAYMQSNPASTDITLGLINSESSWITSAAAADEKSGQNNINITITVTIKRASTTSC
jgi:hypothetical protein